MISNYMAEETKLTKVIKTSVQPASENHVVKLIFITMLYNYPTLSLKIELALKLNLPCSIMWFTVTPATRLGVIPPFTSVILRVRCVSASEHTLKKAKLYSTCVKSTNEQEYPARNSLRMLELLPVAMTGGASS